MSLKTMKFISLTLVLCCVASVVYSQRAPEIRRISITDILNNNPALKAELAAKIKANKNAQSTTKAPVSTTPATTTTPAPQANTPPAETSESTTPVGAGGKRLSGNGQRNGGGRRRRPVVSESSKFGDDNPPPHRLRVVKDETTDAPTTPKRQNGRRFPGSN